MSRIILVGAFFFNIHRCAKGKLIEQSHRNTKSALCIDDCQQHWIIGRMPDLRSMKCIQPCIELLFAVASRERWVVCNIITAPHESINRAQGLAFAFGKDEKSVVEILGLRTRDAPAHRVRYVELRLGWRE